MKKLLINICSRYGFLNSFLISGILLSLLDHKEIFGFFGVGLILFLLDFLDNSWEEFIGYERIGKLIWCTVMLILTAEIIIFYV